MGLALAGGDQTIALATRRSLKGTMTHAILLYAQVGSMRRRSDGLVPAEEGAEP